jgi:hypothetical protein
VLGTAIHAACMCATCFIVPMAMGSNLWPIAGVFWSIMTVPVAMGVGALIGLLVKRLVRRNIALLILMVTAVALAIATGIIICRNR